MPLVLALIIALVAVAVIGAMAIGVRFGHERIITVTATGTATAAPSMAKIYVTMNATGETAYIADANLSLIVDELNSTLSPYVNGNLSMIQTVSYEIYQPTNCTYPITSPVETSVVSYPYCIPTKLPYYEATESVVATIPNMSNVSAAITDLSAIPDLQLQSVQAQLSTSQQSTLNQEALSQALDNATTQASILAGGEQHVTVKNISVQSGYIYYPYALSATASGSVVGKTTNSSEFFSGTISAQKSIYVVFDMH
jgi:uncharacterized protein YggE